MADSKINTNQL